jgi:hypothetical protein
MSTATSRMSTNGHTTLNIKKGKSPEMPSEIDLPEMAIIVVPVKLVGLSPLIVNNFSDKSIQQMEDERRLSGEDKKAAKRQPRPPVDPKERFNAARVLDAKGRDCVQARWIKAALVTASSKYKEIGVPSTQVRGVVFVQGDLIPIECKAGPVLRRDVVRVGSFGNRQPDLRYRPEYTQWSLSLKIEFEPAIISLKALYHLVRRAGSSVGLCEWRPEKSPAGIYGRFDIAEAT